MQKSLSRCISILFDVEFLSFYDLRFTLVGLNGDFFRNAAFLQGISILPNIWGSEFWFFKFSHVN